MRVVLGGVFAVILSRMFHPEFQIPYVILFAVFLVGLAYILEYWRGKKNKK
jgi:protein-S-isoprenylcysteine O-methyltransferase Ste14